MEFGFGLFRNFFLANLISLGICTFAWKIRIINFLWACHKWIFLYDYIVVFKQLK